jgi:hypothetical protein
MVSSSTPKKKKRFGLILPFVLLLLVVGAWSAWWHVASGRINQAVDEWISEQEARGAAFTYAGRHMGGYPFRFELVFDQPAYSGRPGEASWEGDRAEFVMQAWNLTHMIGRMPGHHVITGANGIRNSVDFGGHAAFSLSWNKAGLNRFGFQSGEAQALVGGQVYGDQQSVPEPCPASGESGRSDDRGTVGQAGAGGGACSGALSWYGAWALPPDRGSARLLPGL